MRSVSNPLTANIHRIAVVGTTGSGKSTLAEHIAHCLHVPHFELDALHFGPNWTEVPQTIMRQKVETFAKTDAWVTDGNYGFCRDIIWSRAQAIIWLDYPLPLILWRLWWRTLQRMIGKELLWGTNHERFWTQFFSKDSLFLWAIQTFKKRKMTYSALLSSPDNEHITTYHFRTPRELENWLRSWS